jgi:SH3-like domain-containing protein
MVNEYANWRTASDSNGQGQCVETASNGGTVAVRDTTDRGDEALVFTAEAWAQFTASLR